MFMGCGVDRMTVKSEKTTAAWKLFRKMLDDMTEVVESDAENDFEKLEGLRVVGRTASLCLELNLDVDPDAPRFYSMTTPDRFVGGPNPDGNYYLTMLDGRVGYRIRGERGTTAYLGFQVLAGTGLSPRRMGSYVSDRDLVISSDGTFSFVLAASKPTPRELDGNPWVEMPDDAWIQEQFVHQVALLAEDTPKAALVLRKLLGKVTAHQIKIRGKKRGYIQLRFRIDAFQALAGVLEDHVS